MTLLKNTTELYFKILCAFHAFSSVENTNIGETRETIFQCLQYLCMYTNIKYQSKETEF